MNEATRRAIKFIAGCIVSKKFPNSIYDYTLKCYISGSGSNNSLSLYHYENRKYINLKIMEPVSMATIMIHVIISMVLSLVPQFLYMTMRFQNILITVFSNIPY